MQVAYKEVNGMKIALAVYGSKAGVTGANSADLIFVPSTDWVKNGDNYDINVVFTGDTEPTTITVDARYRVGLYVYTTDANGVYSLTGVNDSTVGTAGTAIDCDYAGSLTNVTNSLLYVNGTTQLNNLGEALVFDATDGEPVVSSPEFIDGNAYGYVVVDNDTDKNVLAVYVVGKYEIMAAGTTITSGTGIASDPFVIDAATSANVTTMAGSNTNLEFKSYTGYTFTGTGTVITTTTTVSDGNGFTLGGEDNNNVGITTVYYIVND